MKKEIFHLYSAIRFNDLIVARKLSEKLKANGVKNEFRNYLIVIHLTSDNSFEEFEEKYKVIQKLSIDNYPSIILCTIDLYSDKDSEIPKSVITDFEEFHEDLINSKIKKTDTSIGVYLSNYYM